MQKLQACILEVISAISCINDMLLDLKPNKDQIANGVRKAMASLIHTYTDLITILDHLTPTTEQKKQYQKLGCLKS